MRGSLRAGWVAQAGKAREVVVVGARRRRRRRAPRAAHDAGRLAGTSPRRETRRRSGRRLCPLAIGTERAGTRGGCSAVAIPPVRSEGWCASVKQTTRGVPSLARLWGRTERAVLRLEGRESARGFESRPSDERTRAHVSVCVAHARGAVSPGRSPVLTWMEFALTRWLGARSVGGPSFHRR